MHPIHLLGIVTSFILYTTLEARGDNPWCKTSRYLQPTLPTVCLRVSVTLCAIVRFTCFHLHKVPDGLPSYSLRAGSTRTDGRDIYGAIGCLAVIAVPGVGTQLPRGPVMTRPPNAGAGGGCYLFPLKFVRVKEG